MFLEGFGFGAAFKEFGFVIIMSLGAILTSIVLLFVLLDRNYKRACLYLRVYLKRGWLPRATDKGLD